MYVAIVGSRRRKDKENVVRLVNSLDKDDTVVSGGCRGVDSWAVAAAKKRGMTTIVVLPYLVGAKSYYEKVDRYYARNKKVAELADIIYAFVAVDRKGGTENTIEHAQKLGKIIYIR